MSNDRPAPGTTNKPNTHSTSSERHSPRRLTAVKTRISVVTLANNSARVISSSSLTATHLLVPSIVAVADLQFERQ